MKEKICGIYCIENLVNGKKYIGQSIDVKSRLADHRRRLRNDSHKNIHLQSSWNTYGEDNFDFYIIEECNMDMIDEKERYYIAKYNTQDDNFGYNIEPGGSTNKSMSQQTRDKISKTLKNREFTEEHCRKIGEANRRRQITDEMRQHMKDGHADMSGVNNPMFGKHHSQKTRNKISEANKGKPGLKGDKHPFFGKHHTDEEKAKISKALSGKNHPRCRPVYCPELDEEFWGAKEAEIKYNIRACYISACLSGDQKTAGKHPITGEPLHWEDAKHILNN